MSILGQTWTARTGVGRLLLGILIGVSLSLSTASLYKFYGTRRKSKGQELPDLSFSQRPIEVRTDEIVKGVSGLIGNTPLVRINSLSNALGVEIVGKAEYLNPGGSVKDRVAQRMIDDAESDGLLHPYTGSRIFEGTVGSTAIIMPDDVAEEKVKALEALGAQIERVRPASIVDKKQNLARERAREFGGTDVVEAVKSSIGSPETSFPSSSTIVVTSKAQEPEAERAYGTRQDDLETKPRGFFADQFENLSNFEAHYDGTGPEIWRQTNGKVSAFVSGAGTGGTIAGTGKFLKDMDDNVLIVLSDPDGSGLYNKVKFGVMYDAKEREGTKRRHQVDTVVEGIGINRLTSNFELALHIIDDAFRITDAEAVAMSRYVMLNDGLFLGSSSACNLFACVKLAKKMGWSNGERIVTILCDSGSRHHSKVWNDAYLQKVGIPIDTTMVQNALKA
ncbi:PALP-domain-containing protein [Fomitiporia mediterranea MF3/22]|uniref:PALP-domain-containing protein n=1 Tax=Fomitiporia mediterranea (strain MF3/22) TaxID=694068 RepID=UPI000440925F|nr:PALP-domain-containing protein [Fomitiporia mediterranea MF3/22]EJD02637.1 PALP-domain-containing protein [Fomitiporia mediterranea MF3/22]